MRLGKCPQAICCCLQICKFGRCGVTVVVLYITALSYIDMVTIVDGKYCTDIYDKRDDFNFRIVNFPYLSSNIPSGPAYGVYISQLLCIG